MANRFNVHRNETNTVLIFDPDAKSSKRTIDMRGRLTLGFNSKVESRPFMIAIENPNQTEDGAAPVLADMGLNAGEMIAVKNKIEELLELRDRSIKTGVDPFGDDTPPFD